MTSHAATMPSAAPLIVDRDISGAARLLAGFRHLPRIDPRVELIGTDECKIRGSLLQGGALAVRLFRDFGSVVVADMRIERGDKHQALTQVAVDTRAVRLDAHCAEPVEVRA